MRGWLKYLIIHPLVAFLLVAVLVLLGAVVLSATRIGTSLLAQTAQQLVPGLQVEGADGTLLEQLVLERFVWQNDLVKVEVQGAKVDATIRDLSLPPKIQVNQLTAKRLLIILPPSKDKPFTPATMPDIPLPVELNLDNTTLDEFVFQHGDFALTFRQIQLKAYNRDGVLHLDELVGRWYNEAGEVLITGKGEMGFLKPHVTQVNVVLESAGSSLGSGKLTLAGQGNLPDYHVQGAGDWAYAGYLEHAVRVAASGNFDEIHFDSLQLQGEAGDVAAEGKLQWAPTLAWDATAQGAKVRPEQFVPDYPGLLDVELASRGSYVHGETVMQLDVSKLLGTLRDYPLDATLKAGLDKGALKLEVLNAQVGENHLQAKGQSTDELLIEWAVDAPQLAQLHPEVTGRLQGNGQLSGKVDGSAFNLAVEQMEGQVFGYPLKARGGLSLANDVLAANDVQVDVGDNHLQLNGVADESKGIDWQVDAKELGQLSPKLSGHLQGKGNAQGLLDGSRLTVRVDSLQGKVLDRPIKVMGQVSVRDRLLTAKAVQLEVGDNRLQVDGVADEAQGLVWSVDAKNLSQLSPPLHGNVQGSGTARGLLDGSRLAVRVDKLQGEWDGRPVKAVGDVRIVDQLVSAHGVQLDLGDNHLQIDGVADERQGINWSLDANNVAQLVPGVGGKLSGKGNLQGLLDGSRLAVRVDNLQGTVRDFPVKVAGRVRVRDQLLTAENVQVDIGDNRLQLDGVADESRGLDWVLAANNLSQLSPELQGKLAGKGNFQGLLDGSRFAVRVRGLEGTVKGFPVNVAGEVRMKSQVLSARDVTVAVGNNRLRLDGVADESQGLAWSMDANNLSQLSPALKGDLKGAGKVRGLLDGSRAAVTIAALEGNVQGYPLKASGEVRIRDKQFTAQGLKLAVGQNQIQLDGVANDKQGVNWSLDAKNLSQLSPELQGELKGSGNVQGLLDGSRLTVRVGNLQGQVQGYPVTASGEIKVKDKLVTAHGLLVDVGQNRLRLNGSAGNSLGVDWELDAKNLSQVHPKLKGLVQGNGRLSGKLDGSQLELDIGRLQGQLDGRPLQAVGKVRIQGKQITLQGVRVLAGENQLEATGRASEPFDVQWKIKAPQLAKLWPGLAGSLKGEGTLRGRAAQPEVQGSLQGAQLSYQAIQVGRLDVQAKQAGGQYDIRGVLDGLRQGNQVIKHAEFAGQGQLARHTLTLQLQHQDGKLDVRASGGLNQQQWHGTLERLALRDTVAGDWQLTSPVGLTASAQMVSMGNACLANTQNAKVCAKTDWSAQRGLMANGVLQQVPLAMARSFLPETIQLPGVLNADYQIEQRGGRFGGRINVQLPDNVVVLRTSNKKTETLPYTQTKASLTLNDRTALVQAQADIRGRGQLRAEGRIDLAKEGGQHRIDVRANLNMPDIGWMQAYSPQIDELKGQINGDVRVQGLLDKPQITGTVRLQEASLYLPETGAHIQDIGLTLQASRPEQMSISGSLRAGTGLLTASGALHLASLPAWSADLRLQGSNLLLMDTYEVQAQVSPDLVIKAAPKSVVITGALRIPETTISLNALPTGASVRSDDIVIVGRGQAVQPHRLRRKLKAQQDGPAIEIQPNVLVELGEKVKVNAFGLNARLSGKLRLLRNRQDIVAEGVLSVVDGVYQAYGQNLKIERGRLLFNGPPDNPGLDVRAVRQVEDEITVGISVGGSVRQPESTLFSTPQQTQTDTLSYLLTGRALSGVSGGESAILTQAITGLGLAGGESLAQSLGGSLGLDDVGLNSGGGDYKQSELSLGKRLGPKLYVKYIVGLFDSLQRIAVTYQINKRLQLEATSGTQQGIDLIYKIDTDKGPFGK